MKLSDLDQARRLVINMQNLLEERGLIATAEHGHVFVKISGRTFSSPEIVADIRAAMVAFYDRQIEIVKGQIAGLGIELDELP